MKREWTVEQQSAIDARSGTILVSAAAGSGKTAVLTERIIESILDANDPVDITDLLVVTFSRPAANELKSRIGAAIRDQLALDPTNKRLRRQQIGLERAEISTIHSFCLKMVGEGATLLGLPAGLRVADPAESKLLMRQVLDRLLEEEYRKQSPSFMALTDNFVTTGDGNFAELLLDLYDKASSMPEGVGIFAIFADQLAQTDRATFLDGAFGQLLLREVGYFAAHYEAEYRRAMRILASDPLYQKTHTAFATEYPFLERLAKPFERFDDLCHYIGSFEPVSRLPSVKSGDKTPAFEEAIEMRNKFKKDLAKLRDTYFGTLLDNFAEDTARTAKLVRSLAELLARFDRSLTDEKLRKGMLDFADMERYTHKLLVENGQPTAYARSVSERYRQIYIDEYQDVNRIQDEIFAAIAADNRFMVGDIKQSIYAFRGAEPLIFADYRKAFSDEQNEEGRLIFLSRNFRCDLPVIELTNEVCRKLFPVRGAEVPYEKADELVHGKKEDSPKTRPVQITLIPSADDESDGDPEAEYVADEIERLIRKEGYRPDDIAIILRSAKKTAPIYESALAKRGITCSSKTERPFYEEPEILLVTALLACIDNPRQDVYFAGALMSPVFGFTLNDLLSRFKVREGECLYELLCGVEDDERIRAFLAWLEHCRAQSSRLASDEMVQLVYQTTALPAIVGADAKRGKEARRNLNQFYQLARSCEQNNFMGLHRFLRFVHDWAESGEAVKSESAAPPDGTVQILTVHQSKGLEFPVCFISETMKGMNLTDSTDQVLFDKSMGMALSLRDDSGFVHYNTLLRKTLAQKLIDSSLEEEMRVLYVALTRAKERLYITAKSKNPEKVLADCRKLRQNYSAFGIARQKNYFEWIMGALDEASTSYRFVLLGADAPEMGEPQSVVDPNELDLPASPEPSEVRELPDWLIDRMNYVYPTELLKDLPAKLTVSALKPDLLDEREDALSDELRAVEKPSFLQMSDEQSLSGAERGTATHVFMQFCDFDAVEESGITDELVRLTDLGFMSAAMADAVYKDALDAFFRSPLYREMREAKLLRREFRFNVRLPASSFTQDAQYSASLGDAKLLVQGVIDCFFEKADGSLKLIDYKTDRLGSSPEECAALLLERYGNQLRYYRMALEELTGKAVSEVVLYSFWQSKAFSYPELLTVNITDANGS